MGRGQTLPRLSDHLELLCRYEATGGKSLVPLELHCTPYSLKWMALGNLGSRLS